MSNTQTLSRIEFAEREFKEYRMYVEAWQKDHDELARQCVAIEDIISKANYVYGRINALTVELKRISTQESAPELRVRGLYLLRAWLAVSLNVEEYARRPEATYERVDGVEALRENIARAQRDVTTSKPVMVDSDGRVFEMSGELAILPGLSPEQIARGIKDADEGANVPSRRSSLQEPEAGLRQAEFELSLDDRVEFGLFAFSVSRGLDELERAELISVGRIPSRFLIVTIPVATAKVDVARREYRCRLFVSESGRS